MFIFFVYVNFYYYNEIHIVHIIRLMRVYYIETHDCIILFTIINYDSFWLGVVNTYYIYPHKLLLKLKSGESGDERVLLHVLLSIQSVKPCSNTCQYNQTGTRKKIPINVNL